MPAEKSKVSRLPQTAPYGISKDNIIKHSRTRSSRKPQATESNNNNNTITPMPTNIPTVQPVPTVQAIQPVQSIQPVMPTPMIPVVPMTQEAHNVPMIPVPDAEAMDVTTVPVRKVNKRTIKQRIAESGRKRIIKQFIISNTAHSLSAFNNLNNEDESVTALRCTMKIADVSVITLIDCGASKTIITKDLAAKLGYAIDGASTTKFVLGNNQEYASLGETQEPVINMMNKKNSALDFLLPEYEESESDEETEDESEEESESDDDAEFMTITNDFHCMTTKDDSQVHYQDNQVRIKKEGKLIIPAKSSVP
ncbi:uncharacterized protein EV154DRAFT_485434 [Mucor mucedo]|uniref:uncharacterized protein n=1 Tax=Mucor mucedo TaxID=29922 RepID=UPI00221FDCFF|nr:uncharacterized protein EV154DRAFT_485434 [Mucor mucedo]KAI7884114.1 hypothetical protein EV154DRAFT_485434 [Mucor mucedo]